MNPTLLTLGLLWRMVTGHLDAELLAAYADSAQVPHVVAWAIAWQETRHNLNPAVRGADGEVGRLQVLPSTARHRCPGLDIYTYTGNLACGMRLLRWWFEQRGSWALAIRAYQCPRCQHETPYERSVVRQVGVFTLKLAEVRP